MEANETSSYAYPMPISRGLEAAEKGRAGAVLRLARYIIYYLGAVAVGQYTQALYLGQARPDPTLNRSLRSLRRALPGQWLGWAARSLAATPQGSVKGLFEWYTEAHAGEIASGYGELQRIMVGRLAYTGEYGPREQVSPRTLLELVDQYTIRRDKVEEGQALPAGLDEQVSKALLPALQKLLTSAPFLREYRLYAPRQRQLLMGLRPTTPMPPIIAPEETEASLLLYPPGEGPDYTRRPSLQAQRAPLFPLDPLLAYVRCPECERLLVAALIEVAGGAPVYLGLDPECGHTILVANEG